MARRAGVPAAVAVAGVLIAAPAFADVTVSPTTAVQGSGENLTFHVINTGTAPLGTISLRIPDDTPVAEVYPLSVDDWAPKIEMKPLATPLATIHGGTPATESAKSITWLAMPGHQLAPGTATDLSIAIGPLPTLSTMQFTLATTYTDGKPGPSLPAQISLTPAAAGQTATHAHGGTATDGTGTAADPEEAAFAAAVADATRGPSILSIGGWVIAGLALLGGAIYFIRNRHRAEDDEPEDEDDSPAKAEKVAEPDWSGKGSDAEKTEEPVAAGKWSLRS
ncbi:hypothetical protein Ate02nite_85820 [Paractinoplanes tereljensis]|uniref:YncI copper-binding domain-containing protein n=2 Tax=Paractinoplanes tereljensis TaxID=571912 RepID=A0A919TZG4_9ACTN|nr:hypothetical protein Ate02nite_85820 [Actinoplanes tereljensis]